MKIKNKQKGQRQFTELGDGRSGLHREAQEHEAELEALIVYRG
jgi:CelD/BcsL family acetyltransferase involved in cellulose biosynthesis